MRGIGIQSKAWYLVKLVSARKKDTADIQALCALLGINTRKKAQKVVDKYVSQDIQENHRVAMKLAILFG